MLGTTTSRLRYTLHRALHHRLALSFYVPALLIAFAHGLLLPVLPLYVADFNVSYGLVGLVLAGDALGTMLGDVPGGLLLRRLGHKRLMAWGFVAIALATVALVWAQSIWLVLALRFAAGLGRAQLFLAMHATIADSVSLRNRGRAISAYGGVIRVGTFAGPAVAGFMAAQIGLRAPFLLFAAAMLVALAVISVYWREPARPTPNAPPSPGDPAQAPYIRRLADTLRAHRHIFAAAGSAQMFAQLIRAGRNVVLPLYGAEILNLDVSAIGIIVSAAWAVDMSLFWLAGIIMDRFGRKWAIVPSFTGQALAMLLLAASGGFWSLLVASCLYGVANGIGAGTMMTIGADLAPQAERGEFLGMWRLIGDTGFTSGPLLAGAIADLLALRTAAVMLAGAGLTAAGLFARFVPETLHRA